MRKLKIKQQFLIVFLIIFIAFLLINLTITNMAGQMVLKKNIEYADNTLEKITAEITYMQEKASSIFNFLQYSDSIQTYFLENNNPSLYENVQQIDSLLTGIHIIYPQLDDITLVGSRLYSNYLSQDHVDSLMDSYGDATSPVCIGITEHPFGSQPIKIVRYISPLYSSTPGDSYAQKMGYCILSFQLNKMNWMRNTSVNDTTFILVDKNGSYYPINCSYDTASSIMDIYTGHNNDNHIDTFQYMIRTGEKGDSPLFLLSCTDKQAILKDVRLIQLLILILSCTTILILIVVVTIVYRNIVSPIYTLQKYMEEIAANAPGAEKKSLTVYGNHEVYRLSLAMDKMIHELAQRSNSLISTTKTLYETEVAKQKMEVDLLRSQINPHFLYNSLETLQGICMMNGLPEAAHIANSLGKIFRYCIKAKQLVPLSEEIRFVQAYIDIQKVRFAHKVSIIYNFSDQTLSMPVLSMILQPLLENAFYHSVEKRTESTTIYLGSFFQDDDLILVVQDDGVGIEPAALQSLKERLQNTSQTNSQHIGLTNVHMRIRLLYGAPYGISIDSGLGEGTKITIRLKKINEKGEFF